jgi:Flp pilus assembly protein TadG
MTTIKVTGTFRMAANGPGGTVKWTWVYKDTNSSGQTVVITHTGSMVVAAGDTSAKFISDSFSPMSSGSGYLIFTSPSYASSSLDFSWACR